MNQTNQAWAFVDPKRLILGFLLAITAAAFAAVALAQPAAAGGGSGSGSGSGSCSVTYGWRFVKSWESFKANSEKCGSSAYNSGKSRSAMAAVGGARCYDHRDEIDAMWYLTGDRTGTIWLRYPSSGHPKTKLTYVKDQIISKTPGIEADLERYARVAANESGIGGDSVIVVCSWPGERSVSCNDLTEWDTKVRLAGAKGAAEYKTRAAAINNCILSCPKANTSAADSSPLKWVRSGRSEVLIPASVGKTDTLTDSQKRGDWCFDRPDTVTRGSQTGTRVDTSTPATSLEYSWRNSISDGTPTVRGKDTIDGQSTSAELSPLYDWLLANKNKKPTAADIAALKAQIAAATRADAVTLSSKNQKALAQGGVLNVTEATQYVNLSLASGQVRARSTAATTSYNFTYSRTEFAAQGSSTGTPAYGAWGAWSDTGSYVLSTTPATPRSRVWQALANHCYANGYNDASGVSGTKIVDNKDSGKNYSGSSTSPVQDPNVAPWGTATNVKINTKVANFYDRECAFEGTRVGAVDSSPQSVTQFRDNEPRALNPGVFKPKGNAVVRYNNETALTTTITRWIDGTPKPNGLSNEGAFRMLGTDGEFFTTGTTAVPVQRNWDATPHKNQSVSIMPGEQSSLTAAANWPSDDGRPQVFTYKWEFAPNVANTIPTTVGFAPGGLTPTYSTSEIAVPIQGKTYSKFKTATSEPLYDDMSDNTGTSVANGLDVPLYFGKTKLNGTRWGADPTTESPYYQVLKYVRSTTE